MKTRRYDDPCGIARALDRVGERWALLVVRELLLGPKRFTDLRAGLPDASPNVLSQRLDELALAGIVTRNKLPPPANAWVYELTAWGYELDAVLLALGRWGSRAAIDRPGALSADALLLALRTTFVAALAGPEPLVIDVRLAGSAYRFAVVEGALTIERTRAEDALAIVETDAVTLRRVAFGDVTLAAARATGALRIEGRAREVARLFRSFRRPTVVPSP